MSLTGVIQTLIFGVFVGSIYGIAALGLGLVFGVMSVLNVAHGELLMIGGYISFWLFTLANIDPLVSLLILGPLMFIIGIVLDRLLFTHVGRMGTEGKIKNSLLISFGLVLIFQQLATILWTADDQTIETSYTGRGLVAAGLRFPYTRLADLGIGLLAVIALYFFLQRTYLGKAIRATAEDWEAASLAGINVQRIYMVTFAIGTALAGIAGALVATGYGISPTIGLSWTLKALVVVVLAGTGSVMGAFPAGLLLGLAEAGSSLVIGSDYAQVVGLVIFLAILLVRPQGLFAKI